MQQKGTKKKPHESLGLRFGPRGSCPASCRNEFCKRFSYQPNSDLAEAYFNLGNALSILDVLTSARMIIHASMARKASSAFLHFKRGEYPEVDPPELVAVALNKARVNVLNRPGQIILTATLTDDRTGVATAVALFQSPSGASITNLVTFQVEAGTPTEGSYRGFLTVPANTAVGVWSLALVRADDAQGNISVWNAEALRSLGFELTFEAVWGGGQ